MEHNHAMPFAPYEVAQANARVANEARRQVEAILRRKTRERDRYSDEVVIFGLGVFGWQGPVCR